MRGACGGRDLSPRAGARVDESGVVELGKRSFVRFAVIGLDQVYYGLTSDTISVNYLTGNRITTPNGKGEAVSMRFVVDPLPRLTDYHAEWNDPSIDPTRKR